MARKQICHCRLDQQCNLRVGKQTPQSTERGLAHHRIAKPVGSTHKNSFDGFFIHHPLPFSFQPSDSAFSLFPTPSTNCRNRSSPTFTFVLSRTAHQLSVGWISAANLQASFSVVTTSS